jgi:hypothetical protein
VDPKIFGRRTGAYPVQQIFSFSGSYPTLHDMDIVSQKPMVNLIHNITEHILSNPLVRRLMRKPRHRAILFKVQWKRSAKRGGDHAM